MALTKKATRMLALMERATTLWTIPVVGRAKGRLIRPRAAYVGPAPRTMETSMASSPKA